MDEIKVLQNRMKKLESLLEMGQMVSSSLDMDTVLESAMTAAETATQAEASSIWQVDEETGELYFRLIRGTLNENVKKLRLKIGEGIAGSVAATGKPLVENNVKSSSLWNKTFDEKSEFKTNSILSVPLKIQDRLIGVLQILNKKDPSGFTKDDEHLTLLLSGQIAIALDNARLYQEKREIFLETATALAEVIEARDRYTGGHVGRVVAYSMAIGRVLDLPPELTEQLKISAILHDVGKIGIADAILNKPSQLNDEEFAIMKRHPVIGTEILQHIKPLKGIIPGMKHHHERMDGKGYPDGLKGEDIPLMARIIAVADTFDAMTTTRPYRKGLPHQVALDELKKFSGTQFCPTCAEAFIKAYQTGQVTKISLTDI